MRSVELAFAVPVLAGGHDDPAHTGHHEEPLENGHLGDLLVLTANADGVAHETVTAPRIDDLSVIQGRALAIHAGGDEPMRWAVVAPGSPVAPWSSGAGRPISARRVRRDRRRDRSNLARGTRA